MLRRVSPGGLLFAAALMAIWLAVSCYGEEKVETGKDAISTKELHELVDLLEDPQKREEFVGGLKNLIRLREAALEEAKGEPTPTPARRARKEVAIEGLFERFESLSGRLVNAAASTFSLLGKTPQAFGEVKAFLSLRENRSRLLRLIGDIAGGILIALIVGLLSRRYVPGRDGQPGRLSTKLVIAFTRVILGVLPYGALLIALFILFDALPSFPLAHGLALYVFMMLLFYRISVEVFWVLLAPEEARLRLLPLNDMDANYFWVWAGRFTKYAAFYFLVTGILVAIGLAAASFHFIRGLLLLVFPGMISVFILQIGHEIRTKYEGYGRDQEGPGRPSKKILNVIIRYWSIVAVAYAWVIFVFVMVRFDKGFSYLLKATIGSAITVAALFVALWLLNLCFRRLFAINVRIRERFPGLEEKTNRYIRIVRKALGVLGVIVALGIIAHIWGVPVSAFVASRTGTLMILRAIAIAITVGIVVAIMETSQFLRDYLLKEDKKKAPTQKMKTLVPLINSAIKIAAGFIGGIVILDQFGVNTKPILAGAGIVGLAVGFGAQSLVKDLINGLFILFQDLIAVGDVAVLKDKGGLVEAVGLRTVTLRDLAGSVHVIPNSSIETVTNMTKGYSRYVFDVGVAYREDVDEVMAVLKEIGEGMRNDPNWAKDILEPLEILGVDRFDDSAVVIRARIMTKPIRQWAVGREFNRRMKKTFDARGIEIPFPHRTVYMGEPKEGPAAPLHVQLDTGRGVPRPDGLAGAAEPSSSKKEGTQ